MGESIPLWNIVAFAVVLAGMIVLFVLHLQFRKKFKLFMKGKDGVSLEATLQWLTNKVASVDDTLEAHKEALEFIDGRVKRSIRGYSLVRYNAYDGAGGEQSFSTGLLDEHGDGYILSVVSNRNHTGVYSKRVISGSAEVSLTEEETMALVEAKKGLRHE